MKQYILPVILLAVGAGIATAASFAAKQGNCCQPAQSCCEAKAACCETVSAVAKDCCQPAQSCCEAEEGDCCAPVVVE
jgi:hypothetical protein